MINKDTILSVYTDKQTLLEYLTKIETALDKAVLTSSQLVYEGANNYHFKFVFEDGSSIETPSITLVKPISKVDFLANGNSVHFVFTLMDGETITTQTIDLLKPVTAAAVRDGILYLTLSDGTEVSAGSIIASFGATTFNGEVIVHGNLQVNGNQTEVGNVSITGDSSVSGTSTSKNVKATGNCDASTFGKELVVSPGASENVTVTLDETSVTPHVSKVGYGIHAHFQLMIVVGSAYVAKNWVNIAYVEGGELQSSYQGKVLINDNKALLNSGAGTLANYGWGIEVSGHSGNLFIDGTALTAGKTYYIDFNQTVNY